MYIVSQSLSTFLLDLGSYITREEEIQKERVVGRAKHYVLLIPSVPSEGKYALT